MIVNRDESIRSARPQEELVGEFLDSLDKKRNTVVAYRGILGRYLKYLKERSIDKPVESDVKHYKDYLWHGGGVERHSSTVHSAIVALRRLYQWTERKGLYPNIATEVENVRVKATFRREPLTEEQAARLIEVAKKRAGKSIQNLRDCAIVMLIVMTGLRTIEVQNADVADIRSLGGIVYLYVQGKGRDEKDERVKLPLSVQEAISAYLEKRGSDAAPLFLNHGEHTKESRIAARTVSISVKHLLRAIGLDDKAYTAHSLRHTCATIALKSGASIQEVSALLRHSSITTTTIYAHNIERETNNCELSVEKALGLAKKNDGGGE